MPIIKRLCFNSKQTAFERYDLHPTPIEHLEYLEKVLPEISISESTKDWVLSMDAELKLGDYVWNPKLPKIL